MSEKASETTSKVVWFGLPADDTKRAQAFYGQLFGRQFQPFVGQDYHMSQDAGGAIYAAPGQIGEAGERQEIPGIGLYARCSDSEGNTLGIYQEGGGA